MAQSFGCASSALVDAAHSAFKAIPVRLSEQGNCGAALYSDVPVVNTPMSLRRLDAGQSDEVRLLGQVGTFKVSAIGHLNSTRDAYRQLVVQFQT